MGIMGAYTVITFCFQRVVFLYTDSIVVQTATILFSILMLIMGVLLVILLRRKILIFTRAINSCIEDMINGKDEIIFDMESETLTGKFNYKLKRLYDILGSSRLQAKAEKQAIQEMISDLSHQVKTPVANLKMYHSMLNHLEISIEKQKEFHYLMETQIDKLDFLMQAMVKMSRLETGIITLNIQKASLYETIGLALGGIVLSAEKKNIEVNISCPTVLYVSHDRKWTAEALFNILDNAVKYTGPGGKISVSAERWEMSTRIDITDTGRGIPEHHLAQIFGRFYREEEVRHVEGVGIGLYLCREIISKQRGYIQVKSRPGQGSTFSVFLPNVRQF